MTTDLQNVILSCGLFAPGDRVVCAVSGGADSMALLWAIWNCRKALNLQVSAAHFNHQLRGEESVRDATFVADFCKKHGIALHSESADVAAHCAAKKMSLEQGARQLRYQFLESLDCDKIAIAHTANDNAETVLLNLLGGTGLRGLCGIPPRRGKIVRPFLGVTRQQVTEYLQAAAIAHVEDSSNQEDFSLRNRIRHELIPWMLHENPSWLENMLQTTAQLRLDENTLRTQTKLYLQACQIDSGYSVQSLCAVPDGLRQRVLRLMLEQLAVSRPQHCHVQAMDALIHATSASALLCLPDGHVAQREYDTLCFDPAQSPAWTAVEIRPNAQTQIAALGLRVLCHPAVALVNTKDTFTVIPHGKIIARPRLLHDRLCGSGGTKSLKKLMIDRKIPRSHRAILPVFADDDGILAVYRLGADQNRIGMEAAVTITVEPLGNGSENLMNFARNQS